MSSRSASPRHPRPIRVGDHTAFDLVRLEAASGIRAQFLPSGALFALRHRQTLINQLLPGPAEDGLLRVLVRWRAADGPNGRARHVEAGAVTVAGPGLTFGRVGPRAVAWALHRAGVLDATTTFALHPALAAWAWRIRLRNRSPAALRIDALHAQDLGLADEAAVRNNEAYVSQYLDLLPVRHPALGWVILARQNQSTAEGLHPWLATGCVPRAVAFCTDGLQFLGADHRVTGEPVPAQRSPLPSRRLQYECAVSGLQSEAVEVKPDATAEITFVARFLDDHPAASAAEQAECLAPLGVSRWSPAPRRRPRLAGPTSLFIRSGWLHGEVPTTADWEAWFPGPRRHEERDTDGALLAFFHGDATHVVSRTKEATVLRPHGHILRSGEPRWVDGEHLGVTCYAAGIFAAQVYLGNPNLARLLSVVRNPLNVPRGSGQRVFVRDAAAWRQLGVPSAFAMMPGEVRWIYRLDDGCIEARVWCASRRAAAFLELRVATGRPREFLVTHQLALGGNEFDGGGELQVHEEAGWMGCRLDAGTLAGSQLPGLCFAIAAAEPASVAEIGGDELVYADGAGRGGPYAAIRTRPVTRCGVILLGGLEGSEVLPTAVAAARQQWVDGADGARPLDAPVRLASKSDPAVARLDEILPWFTHNAGIHFSAPHGLEQYGGAAWGVRDVCQGSIEWLLAASEHSTVRRILETVFARQNPRDGTWPQWFMHPPFHTIQQSHSHGDVCFWPVKALCDYVEATNDLAFLAEGVGYTDPDRAETTGDRESLWAHCDRVLGHCETRLATGTALVDYGDGDWDDTLQPADPTMRTRMVSAWTVALAYQTLRQLLEVCRRGGAQARASRLETLLERIHADFHRYLMPGGTVAGFLVRDETGAWCPLLHPTDEATGIRYRLLPMTRAVLAELFTREEAQRHLDIVARELRYPDGVRLMSEPATYRGGCERLFKRAETAANVGREIGLQYVHAHLRYAEAMGKVGNAEALWWALQVCNPVGLTTVVPNAAARQSNVYFSSSDADFGDRLEAAARWRELRAGDVAVRGGWRLYSSGPGLYLRTVRACLLGVREAFDDVVFDPVLPYGLDGLSASLTLLGKAVEARYRVRQANCGPSAIVVNDMPLPRTTRDRNPYRPGGWRVPVAELLPLLGRAKNVLEIVL